MTFQHYVIFKIKLLSQYTSRKPTWKWSYRSTILSLGSRQRWVFSFTLLLLYHSGKIP